MLFSFVRLSFLYVRLLEMLVPEPSPRQDFSGSILYADVLTVSLAKPSGVV